MGFSIEDFYYFKVELSDILKKFDNLPLDIYYYNTDNECYCLLAKKDKPVSFVIKYKGEKFIKKEDYSRYAEITYPENIKKKKIFEEMVEDKKILNDEKINAMYNYGDYTVEDSLLNPEDDKKIQAAKNFVNTSLKLIKRDLAIVDRLKHLEAYDLYTLRHSVNTFILASSFMNVLSMVDNSIDDNIINDISNAVIFKDIGMLYIPRYILSKTNMLSDEEMEAIKSHPVKGYELFANKNIFSIKALHVIKFHHEKYNGTGYPEGLNKTDIPFFARITTICDTYDSLVSKKTYRNKMTCIDTINFMKKQMCGYFDPKLLDQFIVLLGPKNFIIKNLKEIEKKHLNN
ncbi:MAG: hypothetical protein A2096_01510 [Spirochaetes bacterium GWF1_41_5]|nr:MAG: hypothetical protein A2096_01510 [Spirochaetes bacterium GWF1_41_5]HBE02040.1 hypothetical protein [Spirochaetia bacterium]